MNRTADVVEIEQARRIRKALAGAQIDKPKGRVVTLHAVKPISKVIYITFFTDLRVDNGDRKNNHD